MSTAQYQGEAYSSQLSSATEGGGSCVPNLGNPVFTPQKALIQKAATMVTPPGTPEEMSELQHPMYSTTSSTYGSLQPSVETTPTSFHGRSQKFSKHLSQSGMYRNHSLNTARDHTRV